MPRVAARWAGIVRVSHLGGRGGDRFHADTEQVEDLEHAVARMKDAELVLLPPELDVSGGLPLEKRPSLIKAVEGVERGEFAGIIVSYLSRLGRNVREQLRAWDRVEAAGGRIIVVREGIDTSTAAGRLQRNLLLSIAEHEREAHAERFEERRRKATEAGIWQRRQTPLGYRRDERTRHLVPDERADDVRYAFRARAARKPLVTLAGEIGMTASGVRFLLRNRVYLGELRVGQHVNPTAHEPIVTLDEFLAAQDVDSTRPARARPEPALLAGLVRCCGCGHVMSRAKTKVEVYVCHGHSSAGRCTDRAAVTLRRLDEHVERIALAELARLQARPVDDRAGLDAARAELVAAERELEEFLAAVSAAGLGAAEFAKAATLRRERVDDARDGLARLARRDSALVDGDPVKLWEALGVEQRNRLLRGLLEAVLVRRAGGRGRVVPLDDRVRVIAAGAGLVGPTLRGGVARPITPVVLPDVDDPAVLRVDLGE